MCFEEHQLQFHRGGEVLPADSTRERPHPMQHRDRRIGVLQRAWLAFLRVDPARLQCELQLSACVISGPARDRAHLVE
ncbi:hypothetical protein ACQZET_11650 [Corynebacterium diphtheriae]|uniref:hypothetical protein n=1 Tax=Corynebacterium diphtheriae TaxID=1717 RepID=UPI0002F5694B